MKLKTKWIRECKQKCSAGALLLAAVITPAGFSSGESLGESLSSYPSLVNTCDLNVHEPEGSGGYTFSSDCKVLYVHPLEIGSLKSTAVLPSLDHACGALQSAQESYEIQSRRAKKVEAEIETLETLTELSPAQEKRLQRLQAVLTTLQESIRRTASPYDAWSGGTGSVSLRANTSGEAVKMFTLINQHLLREGVRIERLPILSGIMSTISKNSDKAFPQVLSVENVGRPVDASSDRKTVHSTGSGRVHVEFGLSGACELEKERVQSGAPSLRYSGEHLDQTMVALIDPRFEYTYPAVANIGYHAKIRVDRATELIISKLKTKGEFQVKEISEMLADGDSGEIFEMIINFGNNNPNESADEIRRRIAGGLISEVRDRLTLRLLDSMREIGLVEIVPVEHDVEAPNNGYETLPDGYITLCSTKRFMGVTYRKKCSQQLKVKRVARDGEGQGVSESRQNIGLEISEIVNINEIERLVRDVNF